MNTCKSCVHYKAASEKWDANRGTCDSDKFIYELETPRDGLMYWDYESYSAGFNVGPDFGCIHHQSRESDNA